MTPSRDITDDTARKKLVKARASMVMAHPFFASLALRLSLKEDRGCATAWTNGEVFAYNPDYVRVLPEDKLVGLAAHTVMHPACGHHKRRGKRDPALWNRACDYVINPILLEAGLSLPDGFLFDQAFKDKTADSVYAELEDGEPDEDEEGSQESPDPKDREEGDASGEPGGDLTQSNEKEPDSEQSDPGMAGEVRDGQTDLSPGTGEANEETDWEQALVQAAANARAMGKLPRGIDLFVRETLRPRLPWQQLLAMFVQQSARTDYSWIRPNRRYLYQNIYLPSLRCDQLPELAVAVDTSGSVRPEELSCFGAELSAIVGLNPSCIHLLYADQAVNRYQVIAPWDLPLAFTPKGGGGTDFRPVFEFLEKQAISPYCLIFFSDMACRLFPPRAPAYPVLWVRTGAGGQNPPFGRVLAMEQS